MCGSQYVTLVHKDGCGNDWIENNRDSTVSSQRKIDGRIQSLQDSTSPLEYRKGGKIGNGNLRVFIGCSPIETLKFWLLISPP